MRPASGTITANARTRSSVQFMSSESGLGQSKAARRGPSPHASPGRPRSPGNLPVASAFDRLFFWGSSFNDGTTQTVLDPLGRGPVRTHLHRLGVNFKLGLQCAHGQSCAWLLLQPVHSAVPTTVTLRSPYRGTPGRVPRQALLRWSPGPGGQDTPGKVRAPLGPPLTVASAAAPIRVPGSLTLCDCK